MDLQWLMFCAFLVFLMQAGFLCLETGKTRSKNSFNVAAKNITDFILAACIFWLFGFALMFGDSWNGLIGLSGFVYGDSVSPENIGFFLFQLMFCGTAATLMSGAVAERMSFNGYLIATAMLCMLIYPIVGHWSWASIYNADNQGWLESFGFVDFAGSTVVHSVGGWVALAAVITVGPRLGRFNTTRKPPTGSNLTLSVLGTFLIWLGWFGFNGGSTLALTNEVPSIVLNTMIAALFGGVCSTTYFYIVNRYTDIVSTLNGVLAGLVAITASAHSVSPLEASLIGAIGGMLMLFGCFLMDKWRIDDVLSVVPVHLFAGIWGTLAVALFADLSILGTGLSRIEQFGVQLFGVFCVGMYSFFVALVALKLISYKVKLRVSHRSEIIGMNITEHNAYTELHDLLHTMKAQARSDGFEKAVPVEPFTEVGQIAQRYNRVINRVKDEMSRRDQAIDNFKASEQRKSAILNASMDCIISISAQANIIEFNPAAARIFGVDKRTILTQDFIDFFVLPQDKQTFRNSLKHQFTASKGLLLNRRNSINLQRYDGHQFPSEVAITTAELYHAGEKEFTLYIRDITRQRKLQSKLQHLAYRDPLTGLYNRTYFLQVLSTQLNSGIQDGKSVGVFFLDLDRFKKVNDTLGHQAGDQLLLEVSKRLLSVTRDDDIIARWGGDEFVILVTGELNEGQLTKIGLKVLDAMRVPVDLNGRELKIPTSIGISVTHHTIEAQQLIQQADIAMYFAKEAGRDTYKLFEPEMATRANKHFDQEIALRRALSNKNELTMMYQPKVNVTGTVVGLEALVRWQQEDGSFYPPAEFIPIAEETNLIIPLDEHIFEMVCQQITQWKEANIDVPPVAINVSGKNLLSGNIVAFVTNMLNNYGIKGEQIELEVTEGVLIYDIERCREVLLALHELNIKIAIDDFGTGYSSLSYLKSLPVDILKIDRCFVDECATSEEDGKICETVISLAATLNLITVAEGVETAQQVASLDSMGCDVYQGYYFSRPLSADKMSEILSQGCKLEVSLI